MMRMCVFFNKKRCGNYSFKPTYQVSRLKSTKELLFVIHGIQRELSSSVRIHRRKVLMKFMIGRKHNFGSLKSNHQNVV
jgi:hypothetical protein